MDREYLRKIAAETMQVTTEGQYVYDGKIIKLPKDDFSNVIVFSPEKLQSIMESGHISRSGKAFRCYLFNADSFEAARLLPGNPLVMNFANAIHPGGGFLNGARAQEESLCRCSTLYASLSSKDAKEMYDYNALHLNPVDSDYMLLSPHVSVFRNASLNFQSNSFEVSVITVPAPNRYGRAVDVSQEEIDIVMKERLRKMLYAATNCGYRQLVLGAWGCGAFGNSARRVARYFYELFFEDGMEDYFDTVVFAILRDQDKIRDFSEVFGDKLENHSADLKDYDKLQIRKTKPTRKKIQERKSGQVDYLLAGSSFPVCNHDGADEGNLGYAVGIMQDGTPFEAEHWTTKGTVGFNVVLPIKEFPKSTEETNGSNKDDEKTASRKAEEGSITQFSGKYETQFYGILCGGMIDLGQETDDKIIEDYVEYICSMHLVRFTGQLYNGAVFYREDDAGQQLAEVRIALSEDDLKYAETDLTFRGFPGKKINHLKFVK